MNSLCVSAFARELGALIEQLRYEGHPALARFLPFYSEDTLRQVSRNWETLAGLKEELTALRLYVQQLWYCCVPQTQQQFGFPATPLVEIQPTPPAPKRIRKDRPRKKKTPPPPPPPLVVSPEYADVRPYAQEPARDDYFDLSEFLIPNLPT